jgi:6,7-dimethyl-8-ribityllumazine synthase
LNVQTDIPVIFCVLTDNTQQSIDRSGGIHGNKGTEAAIAIKMALFANRLLTHQKKSKFIAHWSFADRQRIAFRVEGIEQ